MQNSDLEGGMRFLVKKMYRIFIKYPRQKMFYNNLDRFIAGHKEINVLFPAKELRQHYVHEPARQSVEHPDLFINQIRYYRMYQFFRNNYPQLFDNKTPVVDVGDTSGVLFSAMQRKGLSVNINPNVVDFIRNKGIEAEAGDLERLGFKDKAFEYAFCFQCLEHCPNPILALKELSRVTRKLIFLSIPYVKKTAIYSLDYWKGLKAQDVRNGGWSESSVRDVDCHIFEFSTQDFKKILGFTPLKYRDNFPINYFSPLGASRRNEKSYFNFFILEPT